MCLKREQSRVRVKIPADLSFNGKSYWKRAKIDSCIAPIVGALQKGGIDMRGSCCGHLRDCGNIELQDGRVILILSQKIQKEFGVAGTLSLRHFVKTGKKNKK